MSEGQTMGDGRRMGGEAKNTMQSYASWLPPRAHRVVEFGCGEGEMGRRFRQIQPDCRYIGVDTDEAALRRASVFLDGTACESLFSMDFPRHGIHAADCLVYHGEFLEGMTAGKMREHAETLAQDGQMVFLLDNTSYFRNAMNTLSGRKPLAGRLTLEELCAMAGEAGLVVERVVPIYAPEDEPIRSAPETEGLIQAFTAWCRQQQWSVRATIWAKAFVVRMVKQPVPPRMLIREVVGERITARVRLFEPHAFCRTMPGVDIRTEDRGTFDLGAGEGYPRKVMLRQRMTYLDYENSRKFVERMRAMRYLMLYEMDDNPILWRDRHELSRNLDFIGCHAVQASTPTLAQELRQYNPHVHVFPNQMSVLPPPREYAADGPVTIFFGALNREKDWQDIMPALNDAAKHYGEKLQFKVIADKAFFAALQSEHKAFIGRDDYFEGRFSPYPVYAAALHSVDIALMPLKDTPFNRMKSDLKFIEAAAHGAVALASPTVYQDTLRDGRTGFLYRSPREFRERLKLLIEDRSRRLDIADEAYRYVRHHRLQSQHYEERIAWYDELFARWEELDREMGERLEKLDQK